MAGRYFEQTYDEIAKGLGVTANAFQKRASKFGIDSPLLFARGKTSKTMVCFNGEVCNLKEASRRSGIKYPTLQKRLKKLGPDHPELFSVSDLRKNNGGHNRKE